MKATTDDLTGCFNRSTILQQLESALAANARQDADSHFCVLMFDLDFFKQINDRWGHQVGDRALIHFCQAIRELSPENAALGRVGGEEFCSCWHEPTATRAPFFGEATYCPQNQPARGGREKAGAVIQRRGGGGLPWPTRYFRITDACR